MLAQFAMEIVLICWAEAMFVFTENVIKWIRLFQLYVVLTLITLLTIRVDYFEGLGQSPFEIDHLYFEIIIGLVFMIRIFQFRHFL